MDGKSAYDLAAANGYTGTVTQWLASLVGAQGATGPQGPKGDTGAQGPAGPTLNTCSTPPAPHLNYAACSLAGDWSYVDARGANLTSVRATGMYFNNANLDGANLTHARLDVQTFGVGQSGFAGSMDGVSLVGANLHAASISLLPMRRANLRNADLTQASFYFVELTGDLSGANLTGATFVSSAVGVTWNNTICPDGSNSDNNGGTCAGHGGGL